MRLLVMFVLGALLASNVMLLTGGVPNNPLAGIGMPRAERPERGFPATYDSRYEEMKMFKTMITAAVLAAFAAQAQAQTAPTPADIDVNLVTRSVVMDNLKQVAGSGAQNLATSGQALSAAQSLLFQNSTAHAARINAITERALAQVMVVGATEGAAGIKTVNEAGTTRDVATMLGLLQALVANQKQATQVIALPASP